MVCSPLGVLRKSDKVCGTYDRMERSRTPAILKLSNDIATNKHTPNMGSMKLKIFKGVFYRVP